MIEEKCLLIAVRDRLQEVCGYTDQQCEIEFDELAPATVGELYVVVQTEGYQRGPHQDKSGTVRDMVFNVGVTAIQRARNVPRDRSRNVFLSNLHNLNAELEKIAAAIDWKYEVVNAANELLLGEGDEHQGFHHPLVWVSVDAKPRLVGPDVFAAVPGKQAAGMARTVHFGAARRTRYVNVKGL